MIPRLAIAPVTVPSAVLTADNDPLLRRKRK